MAIIVREWRMDALHDLYALGDPNEIIGRVDAMNEHNACVTALRAALAREAELQRLIDEALQTAEGPSTLQDLVACFHGRGLAAFEAETSAARLKEALRLCAVWSNGMKEAGCDYCRATWVINQPESHVPGCLAALGQEDSK